MKTSEEITLRMMGETFAIKKSCPNYFFVVEYEQFVTHHKGQREKVGKHVKCFGKDGKHTTDKTTKL